MNEIVDPTWSVSDAASLIEPAPTDERTLLRLSGLFDERWYQDANPDIVAQGLDPLTHFVSHGWREGRCPNAYFDTRWYLQQNPHVVHSGINPLVDYIGRGEQAGCAPSAWFDLLWYRTRHAVAPRDTLLRHYLARRLSGTVSPLPEFDAAYYLATYTDIAQAGVDPFEHYLNWGFREGRNPSAQFDTRFYVQRYLDGDRTQNPLLHYRQLRHVTRLHTTPPASERAVFDEVRRFTRPGPLFERFTPLPRSARRRAKILAYYLPQFHAVPENDAWWGDGFTEWTFVGRGQPRFVDHYQPRTPRDLGHYSLDDPATMRRQIAMARDAGLFGFVMYFYWFNGRRLLERPLEAFLADATLEFPFCLMWANENWTRRWDGSEQDVLISQDYRVADDATLVDEYARHFRDPRYIRIGGRPVLMVYRPRLIPHTAATVARWRRLFAERHGETPLLIMAQSFGDADPRPFGFDAAIEFPPHKLVGGLRQRDAEFTRLDVHSNAQIFSYDDVAAASLAEPGPDFPLIKTLVPSWDNDARRQGGGLVLQGGTPAKYQAWLEVLVDRAEAQPFLGEPLVCVNAWNEWAEGAYLEPDVHYGAAFANATGRAVTRLPPPEAAGRLLLVGHDAFPAGAQHLLLHLGRVLRRRFGVQVEFLLLAGGAMLRDYETLASTTVAADTSAVVKHLADAVGRGVRAAIVNTSAAASVVAHAANAGLSATLLVHELPRFLRERDLLTSAAEGASAARRVVFAARSVADAFTATVPIDPARVKIMPQGCYRPATRCPAARARIRSRLGIGASTRLVLAAGTGDLRKGFDLFLQAWRATRGGTRFDVAFCWVGEPDPGLHDWLAPEIAAAQATGTFFAPGFQGDVSDWFSAADLFALPSREDPFPTVVLEALSAGLPVVAFAGSGGAPDLITRLEAGAVVAMGDAAAMAGAIVGLLEHDDPARGACLEAAVRREFDFDAYAAALLREAHPNLVDVSVVVTSCDYARYLPGRLAAIFAQTVPVAEVLVFDDASADNSVAVAHATAADWQRDITVIENDHRSGSPFGQWRRAAMQASAEWLWIAESDDAAEPGFLAAATAAIQAAPDLVMAVCDSRVVDADGKAVWPNYQGYYADSGATELSRSFVLPAREFARRFLAERNLILNASAVLWRRRALLDALERCVAELPSWRLAGDWRLYLEVLAQADGSVAWIAEPLNVHRRHRASVTRSLGARRHGQEIARMHAILRDRLALDPQAVARQAAYPDGDLPFTQGGLHALTGERRSRLRPPRRRHPYTNVASHPQQGQAGCGHAVSCLAAGPARLSHRCRSALDGHVSPRLPRHRSVVRRPPGNRADHLGDVVRRARDRADHSRHALGPIRPTRTADCRNRDLHPRLRRLRDGAGPRHTVRVPPDCGVRGLSEHGDPARDGPRPRRRSCGRTPDEPVDAGHGRGADPCAHARRLRARRGKLARDLLDRDGLRRGVLPRRGRPDAGHAAPAKPGKTHPWRAGDALRRHPPRARVYHARAHGRLRDVRHVRLHRRLAAGLHRAVPLVAAALRRPVRMQRRGVHHRLADQSAHPAAPRRRPGNAHRRPCLPRGNHRSDHRRVHPRRRLAGGRGADRHLDGQPGLHHAQCGRGRTLAPLRPRRQRVGADGHHPVLSRRGQRCHGRRADRRHGTADGVADAIRRVRGCHLRPVPATPAMIHASEVTRTRVA